MKNLFMAAALGATALVPITAYAQTATQPAQTQQPMQPQMTQQPAQMQASQIQQLAVSDLMDREVVSEEGEPVGTVAGIVQQQGAEPLLVIEMQQDRTQVLLPMDRVSMRDQQIVAEGMQDGQLTGAQSFGQEQQAQFQPVDEQQQVSVRTQQAEMRQTTGTTTATTTAPADRAGTQQQMASQDELEIQGGFVVRQGLNQVLGSNLMDADVIGATGENIGKVDDVLMDGEGRVLAIIVGVGGFLGIGERDVAIPVDALNLVTADATVAGNAPAQPMATGTVGQTAPAPGQPVTAPGTAPGMAPTTATDTTARQQPRDTATTGTGWGWDADDVLQHIEVAFTREQLEEAPEFARLGESR